MRRILSLLTAVMLTASLSFAGGSKDGQLVKKSSIVMVTNASGDLFEATKIVIEKFMQENPDIKVEFSTQTKDYEALMKAKMAANDLPDVFATHGWSVNRYSEYLLPLNDQPFVKNITETLLPIVTTPQGNITVLPINLDQGGVIYNKDVLKDIGREIPKTYDEFLEVCQVAKDKGYIPVYIAGKDDRQPANLLDLTALTWLVSDKKNNHIVALKNATFDWKNWDRVAQFLLNLKTRGFFNIDAVTADPIGIADKLASGKVLFMFQNNSVIKGINEINPNANFGMMPIPAATKTDEPVLCGGEREAYGVWKDSKNKEAALALLNFMAKPENIRRICEASSMPSGIKGVEVNLGKLTEDYKKYSKLRTFPYFDREYLPGGMWAVLRTTGGSLLAEASSATEASRIMKENYIKLRAQQ